MQEGQHPISSLRGGRAVVSASANANGGLKWVQKGGYSECNKHLKVDLTAPLHRPLKVHGPHQFFKKLSGSLS